MLEQKNRINMILYNTVSWSEGAFIPTGPDQHDVLQNWIQSSRSIYTSWTGSAGVYPNQQEIFYRKNRIHMLLYNTGSRLAGANMPVEPDQHDVT